LHTGLANVVEGNGGIDLWPLDEMGLPEPDLLKIDIEGAEWWALRGARQMIARSTPHIIFEVD
jgi:FkbM family methyltransferase